MGEQQQQQQPTPTPPPPPTPFAFDQYGKIPRDDAKARLDNFANVLQEDPNAQGYITTYAGRDGRFGEAERRAKFAREYLINKRGIDAYRIATQIGGLLAEPSTELAVVPPGASPPSLISTPLLPPSTPIPTPVHQVVAAGRMSAFTSHRLNANERYQQALRDALSGLRKGSIFFEPEQSMHVGVVQRVTASVTVLSKEDVERVLPRTTNIKVFQYDVSPKMKARLTGRADEFKIEPKSEGEQSVYDDGSYTTWEWDVTPLKEGTYKLELRTVRLVELDNGKEAVDREEVRTREITVKVGPSSAPTATPTPTPAPSPSFMGKLQDRLIEDWDKVLTLLILPPLAWLGKKLYDRIKRGRMPDPGSPE